MCMCLCHPGKVHLAWAETASCGWVGIRSCTAFSTCTTIKATSTRWASRGATTRLVSPPFSLQMYACVYKCMVIDAWWPLTGCRSLKGSSKFPKWLWGSFTPPFGLEETAIPVGRKGYTRLFVSWTARSQTPSDCPAAPWADSCSHNHITGSLQRISKETFTVICSLMQN